MTNASIRNFSRHLAVVTFLFRKDVHTSLNLRPPYISNHCTNCYQSAAGDDWVYQIWSCSICHSLANRILGRLDCCTFECLSPLFTLFNLWAGYVIFVTKNHRLPHRTKFPSYQPYFNSIGPEVTVLSDPCGIYFSHYPFYTRKCPCKCLQVFIVLHETH